jgi:uncharacterized protein (TIGR03663 family)
VGTGSTKSPNRNKPGRANPVDKKQATAQATEPERTDPVSRNVWFILCLAILIVAAILRLYDLNLVPLHHDEGVNGNFLVRLVREGYYHYDPANYHGPTLYYFAAALPKFLGALFSPDARDHYGLTTVAIRCVPAFFGLATIALIFTLRKNLGTIATLVAAFLLAVSPGAVYLSRYFIHETLFVFFTLGIVVGMIKYYESAQPFYLLAASVSAALLFATKETAIISVLVLLIALAITTVYRVVFQASGDKRSRAGNSSDDEAFLDKASGPVRLAIWILVAIALFVGVNVLFYSSFFSYAAGINAAFKTFQFWTKTGQEAHVHPFATYLWWLMEQESPLLVLGGLGAVIAVLRPGKSMGLFSALWAFGLTAAYSLIAYKTPWLQLNFILPLALTAGVAVEWVFEALAEWQVSNTLRWAVVAGVLLVAIGPLAGVARVMDEALYSPTPGLVSALRETTIKWGTFIPGFQTYDLNFVNYDNDNRYYVYVYAHTRRDTIKLVDEINKIAERTHQGDQTGITIVSPDYWPLPWYLRDYKRVGYFGHMSASNEPVIIAKQDQAAEVQATFGDRYQQVHSGLNVAGSYALRPGVDLLLYTRRELVR